MFYILTTLSQPNAANGPKKRTLWRIVGPISGKAKAEKTLKICGYVKNFKIPDVWTCAPDDDEFEFSSEIIEASKIIAIEPNQVKDLCKVF